MIARPGPRTPPALQHPCGFLVAGGVGLGVVLVLTGVGPGLAGFDPGHVDTARRLLPPGSFGHRLGTDQLGRDVLARILVSFRWSLAVGLVASLIAAVVGTTAGLAAGRDERWLRAGLSRLVDTVIGFPALVLAVAVIAVAGHGFWALVIVLGLVSWVSFARVTARTLPVAASFVFADLLVAEVSLSFLGLGAPPGTPSWGGMLADARQYAFSAPWMLYAPAAAVVLAVLTCILLGDGLAQVMGPTPAQGVRPKTQPDLGRPCTPSGPPPRPVLAHVLTNTLAPVLRVGGPAGAPGHPTSRPCFRPHPLAQFRPLTAKCLISRLRADRPPRQ